MKHLLAIIIALSVHCLVSGEVLRFFVLPKDAAPLESSSLEEYQRKTTKLGAPVLEVSSLAGADVVVTRSASIVHDASGKVTKESAREAQSIKITMAAGFQERFGDITEKNVDHRMMIVLGDWILMSPFVRQRIDTDSFLISLPSSTTSEDASKVITSLRAMVKKPEANQSSQRNAMAWPSSVFDSRSSRG
jgi:preprotein translocase subunit SecD